MVNFLRLWTTLLYNHKVENLPSVICTQSSLMIHTQVKSRGANKRRLGMNVNLLWVFDVVQFAFWLYCQVGIFLSFGHCIMHNT